MKVAGALGQLQARCVESRTDAPSGPGEGEDKAEAPAGVPEPGDKAAPEAAPENSPRP